MKVLIVLSAIVVATLAQRQEYAEDQQQLKARNPSETTTYIPIIRFEKDQGQDGSYKTSYETGNNIIAEENGYLRAGENDTSSIVQEGQYSYTSPEGQLINVQYTADEYGFHAVGDHIPTPPPIPEEIQKGLDQIYAGIKANQERAARDPEFAAEQAKLNGGYYPQQYQQ